MQIHIGAIIRDELRRQSHTNEWLAERLYVNIRTINKIFLKQTIDTQQLYQISKVLHVDFFSVYSELLRSMPDLGNPPDLGKVIYDK